MTDGKHAGATAQASRGIDLFRVGQIQISIDYSWFAIFFLVLMSLAGGYFPAQYPGYAWWGYVLVGIAATLLFFASVLVHELSHAVVANSLGENVRRISLFIFGGMAHLSGEPKNPLAELKIAAVGPLTSFGLAAVFWLFALGAAAVGLEPMFVAALRYLAIINVALAVFNLLPGFPLDGGRLLRAYFWHRSGSLPRATAHAADWGKGIAVGLMVLGALQIFSGALVGGFWLILIGLFLRGAAYAGYYGVVVEQVLGRTQVRDIMVSDPVTLPSGATVAEAIEDGFLRRGFGGFPVVRDGRSEGIVSLKSVRDCPPEERTTRRVADVMHPIDDSVRISPSASVSEALSQMAEAGVGRLLVMEDGRCLGLITQSGIVRYLQTKMQLETDHAPSAFDTRSDSTS